MSTSGVVLLVLLVFFGVWLYSGEAWPFNGWDIFGISVVGYLVGAGLTNPE